MKYPFLTHIPLFVGFSVADLSLLLSTLAPVEKTFAKGETLLSAGTEMREIGVILYGSIEVAKDTIQGNRFLVAKMGVGGVFGDVLSGGHSKSPVTVTAHSRCDVLLFSYHQLLSPPQGCEKLYLRLLSNLVGIISDKYFTLDKRIELLLIHGLRRRIAAYLLGVAAMQGGNTFTISYNRTQLAHFLGCERSALSRELSRMVHDGLIDTQKSRFTLLQPELLQKTEPCQGNVQTMFPMIY